MNNSTPMGSGQQPEQPWNQPQQPSAPQWGQAPGGQPQQPGWNQGQPMGPDGFATQPQPQTRSRSKAVPVIAAVAGAAVVLGIGGALAASRLAPSAGDPEDILPGNTFAFAKVDLDPSIGQKVAYLRLRDVLAKDDKDLENAKEPADLVCSSVLKKLNCENDVKPWLGERFAVAAWPSSNPDSPRGVVVLKAKDTTKAKAAVSKEYPKAVFEGDFVVLDLDEKHPSAASMKADVEAAGTLADNKTYVQDVKALNVDTIANLWVDLKPAVQQAKAMEKKSATPGAKNQLDDFITGSSSNLPMDADAQLDKLEGRMVGGLTLKDDGVGLRVLGIKMSAGFDDAMNRDFYSAMKPGINELGKLPADAQMGMSIGGLGPALAKQYETLSAKDKQSAQETASELGLSLPDDIVKILGSETAFGASLKSQDSFVVTGRLKGADDSRVAKVVDFGKQQLAGDPSAGSSTPNLSQSRDGDVTVLTLSDKGATAASGTLGDTAKFKRALPDASTALMAAFVDIEALSVIAPEEDVKDAGYLGLTVGYDVDEDVSTMNVEWVLN